MSKKALGIVAAAATGFVAGILFAPKSGKETREDIKRKAGEAKDYTVETAGVVKDKASAGYAAAREGATEIGKEASGFINRASAHAKEVARDAKSTADVAAKDAKATRDSVKKATK